MLRKPPMLLGGKYIERERERNEEKARGREGE
jgi:hypothetical protein